MVSYLKFGKEKIYIVSETESNKTKEILIIMYKHIQNRVNNKSRQTYDMYLYYTTII